VYAEVQRRQVRDEKSALPPLLVTSLLKWMTVAHETEEIYSLLLLQRRLYEREKELILLLHSFSLLSFSSSSLFLNK
jgi:hypothetical protein